MNARPLILPALRRAAPWFASVVVLAALWEVIRRVSGASPLAMPSLGAVAGRLAGLLRDGALWHQIAFSIGLIALALVIATTAAIALVIVADIVRPLQAFLDTVVTLFHPLPGVALLPVIILWFGIGTTAVLIVIVHSVLWPLLTSIRAGHRAVPSVYHHVGRNFGLRGPRLFFSVTMPAIMPFVLSGLRIAWARGWRALISAEMIFGAVAGSGGIGWFLHSRRVFMDTPGLFAGIIVVMLIGVTVETLVLNAIERRTTRRWGGSA